MLYYRINQISMHYHDAYTRSGSAGPIGREQRKSFWTLAWFYHLYCELPSVQNLSVLYDHEGVNWPDKVQFANLSEHSKFHICIKIQVCKMTHVVSLKKFVSSKYFLYFLRQVVPKFNKILDHLLIKSNFETYKRALFYNPKLDFRIDKENKLCTLVCSSVLICLKYYLFLKAWLWKPTRKNTWVSQKRRIKDSS